MIALNRSREHSAGAEVNGDVTLILASNHLQCCRDAPPEGATYSPAKSMSYC